MQNGIFEAPADVLLGAGSSANVGQLIVERYRGASSIAFVVDVGASASPTLRPLRSSIESAGVPISQVLIDAEPTEAAIDSAVEDLPAGAVVVGVGGGSAMDTAKILAAAIGAQARVRDLLGTLPPLSPVAPLILVPTTVGTGSEATRIAMVTVDDTKRAVAGRGLIPEIAILDSDLVVDLPGSIAASTGLDAIAHAAESVLSRNRTALSLAAAFDALDCLLEAVPAAAVDSQDRSARAAAQIGAFQAGLALNAGVILGHSIAYGIALFGGLPHGVTSGLALPYCLAYNDPARGGAWVTDADLEVASKLALRITDGSSDRLTDATRTVTALLEEVGLPTSLREVGITRAQAAEIAVRCVTHHPRASNPRPFDRDALRRLLDAAWSGDLDEACRR